MVQYEIKVNGRVQGVGFRYYTQQQARILNLTGWVRNTLDGGVMAMVQGPKHAVETLVDYLWIGPPMSEVKSVTKYEMQIIEEFSEFSVKH